MLHAGVDLVVLIFSGHITPHKGPVAIFPLKYMHTTFSLDLFLIYCLAKFYPSVLRSLQGASGLSGEDQ